MEIPVTIAPTPAPTHQEHAGDAFKSSQQMVIEYAYITRKGNYASAWGSNIIIVDATLRRPQ